MRNWHAQPLPLMLCIINGKHSEKIYNQKLNGQGFRHLTQPADCTKESKTINPIAALHIKDKRTRKQGKKREKNHDTVCICTTDRLSSMFVFGPWI